MIYSSTKKEEEIFRLKKITFTCDKALSDVGQSMMNELFSLLVVTSFFMTVVTIWIIKFMSERFTRRSHTKEKFAKRKKFFATDSPSDYDTSVDFIVANRLQAASTTLVGLGLVPPSCPKLIFISNKKEFFKFQQCFFTYWCKFFPQGRRSHQNGLQKDSLKNVQNI